MSIKTSGAGIGNPETKSAAVFDDIASGTTEDSAHALEASEDRLIVGVLIQTAVRSGADQGAITAEVSFSSQALMNQGGGRTVPVTDETGAGILAVDNTHKDGTNGYAGDSQPFYVEFDGREPQWDEDEELNIHVRNTTGGTLFYRIVIHYVRVHDC